MNFDQQILSNCTLIVQNFRILEVSQQITFWECFLQGRVA